MRPNEKVRPPLLRRLMEADPTDKDSLRSRGYTANDLFTSLRRDLENILNARRRTPPLPEDLDAAGKSILAYGLPELSSLPAHTQEDWTAIAQVIKETLERHDPRLANVEVKVDETPGQVTGSTLRFHVQADLLVRPAQKIAFDTLLKLFTGAHEVHFS